MAMPQRFVNQRVLQYITWPQYRYGCSLASLTCVVNYLFADKIGIQTPEQVADAIGKRAEDIGWDGGPSNKTLIKWYEQFIKASNLQGAGRIEFTRKDVQDFDDNDSVCSRFDAIVRDPGKIMILSESNHLLLIAGYFDAADDPEEVYESSELRWIVLADHYPGDLLDHLPENLHSYACDAISVLANHGLDLTSCLTNSPVRCRRWRDMRKGLIQKGHRILTFEQL